jgi:ubiquinone/menaquinone biosynthesis C-methylase UbiE
MQNGRLRSNLLFIHYLKIKAENMKNTLFGNEVERMPDFTFRMMKLFFIFYYFFKPAKKYLRKFGIKPGSVIIDYGCGTGACIRAASELVGEKGIVYAVDVHEMAIECVDELVNKHGISNVKTILTDGKKSPIPDKTADLIYALDMFHMVKETDPFLKELYRIIKPEGILILEDGHQPRSVSKEKIMRSGVWKITGEEKRFLKCSPEKKIVS